ncbi:MAG TPA: PP2C family serine/threonine-protein phosphatase [Candidatus Brocadiia bacterium]|nr:PP2C family serine/threonine-protein phosphatase [Candidatus Brocadiia bacterium]
MWRIIASSVTGTSHVTGCIPNQDFLVTEVIRWGAEDVLVVICADGAGSAALADTGSSTVCTSLINIVREYASGDTSLAGVTRDRIADWIVNVRAAVTAKALEMGTQPKELASTLLGAFVGSDIGVFFQIGDGCMVIKCGDSYEHIIWPQTGEYMNETNFVIGERALDDMDFVIKEYNIDKLAVFTDGLELLLLDYKTHTPHRVMFDFLFSNADSYEDAIGRPALDALLSSPRISERTDDDKTLLLAVRVGEDAKTSL